MKNKNNYWPTALRIMVRLTGWIAFPVIIAIFLGKWLDRRYDTEPWLFLLTIGISFTISMIGLVINAVKEFKKIEREVQAKPDEKNNKDNNSK